MMTHIEQNDHIKSSNQMIRHDQIIRIFEVLKESEFSTVSFSFE